MSPEELSKKEPVEVRRDIVEVNGEQVRVTYKINGQTVEIIEAQKQK